MPATDGNKRAARLMVALGGVGALIGAALIGYFEVAKPLMLIDASKQWQATTCEVTSSAVDKYVSPNATRLRDRMPTYTANIAYRYTVAGQVYRGTRERFTHLASNDEGVAKSSVYRYRVGTTTPCWYDPAAPSESVLDRDASSDLQIAVFPLGLLVAGIGMLLFVAFGNWNNVWVRTGGVTPPPGSPPFVAPEGIRDVGALLAARLATRHPRHPDLARATSGSNRRVLVLVILAIILFVAAVAVYGYRTFASLP